MRVTVSDCGDIRITPVSGRGTAAGSASILADGESQAGDVAQQTCGGAELEYKLLWMWNEGTACAVVVLTGTTVVFGGKS